MGHQAGVAWRQGAARTKVPCSYWSSLIGVSMIHGGGYRRRPLRVYCMRVGWLINMQRGRRYGGVGLICYGNKSDRTADQSRFSVRPKRATVGGSLGVATNVSRLSVATCDCTGPKRPIKKRASEVDGWQQTIWRRVAT